MPRRYMAHRRAYWPRLWPMLVGAGALDIAVIAALGFPPWPFSVVIGLVIGLVYGNARIWLWRRRHPVMTARQWLDERRRAAPWN